MLDGHYQVYEGVVADFVPGDVGDHRPETWTLRTPSGSFTYSYSPSILTAGYDQTAANGGLIANGVHLRVRDVGGSIARLEIAP